MGDNSGALLLANGLEWVGRWNDSGTMDEEWLFWDNATYMKQIGLAK
jgi:hypothetical protein